MEPKISIDYYLRPNLTIGSTTPNFSAVPLVPHLPWCKFKEGFMYFAENKSSVEKSYATGFRSSEYISALIQTYLAVSWLIYIYILIS